MLNGIHLYIGVCVYNMNVYNIFTNSLMNTWATINMGYRSLFAERNCFNFIFIFLACSLGFQRI